MSSYSTSSASEGAGSGMGIVVMAAGAAIPVAALLGTGWLAWQGGRLMVEAGLTVAQEVADRKQEIAERERLRMQAAVRTRKQLMAACQGILGEMEQEKVFGDELVTAQREGLKAELQSLLAMELPKDVEKLEGMNLAGFARLEAITHKQKKLGEMQIALEALDTTERQTVADLMEDIRRGLVAAGIREMVGKNLCALDPEVLERNQLNERRDAVVGRIMEALAHVEYLAEKYGLPDSSDRWLRSCFGGVDGSIQKLSAQTIQPDELKKGIRRLEELMEQYDFMLPTIDQTCLEMKTLYDLYADVARALGEKVVKKKEFKDPEEIQEKLRELEVRSRRAQECADLYKKLGKNGYICYAWDQELTALGYQVHNRREIMELAKAKPMHAKIGEVSMPFYEWGSEDLTQLYSVAGQCELQVIVHEDGTVSMQTIATGEKTEAQAPAASHCSKLKALHENLRRNWFLTYDYTEDETPEEIKSVEEWLRANGNAWRSSQQGAAEGIVTEQRKKDAKQKQQMRKED